MHMSSIPKATEGGTEKMPSNNHPPGGIHDTKPWRDEAAWKPPTTPEGNPDWEKMASARPSSSDAAIESAALDFVLKHSPKGDPEAKRRRTGRGGDEGEFSEYVLARPELHQIALYGVLKDMVEAACANSEAVPSTVGIHILARFATTIGRTAFIQIGDQQRHLRMNALIVGPTAKGRKGTSADMPRELFKLANAKVLSQPAKQLTALATGEGLIHQLRDPYEYYIHGKAVTDPGVADKRLFCDISEFAGVLAQARRDGATISTVLRDAFDGVTLTTPTKTSFTQASDTHIVVVGSVPETEIVRCLSSTDITNGMANRFAMFYSVRTKTVAMPEATDPALMQEFSEHIACAIKETVQLGRIRMDSDATAYWPIVYDHIENQILPPAVASLLARQSTYTLIFSALLALLNREHTVGRCHIDAALAWMRYWEETALFVFSNGEQNEAAMKIRKLEDDIIATIAELGGEQVSHTAIAVRLTNNYKKKEPCAKDIKKAAEQLQRGSPPRIRTETIMTDGRPANLYSLIPH
jgi:hypothetical protein